MSWLKKRVVRPVAEPVGNVMEIAKTLLRIRKELDEMDSGYSFFTTLKKSAAVFVAGAVTVSTIVQTLPPLPSMDAADTAWLSFASGAALAILKGINNWRKNRPAAA